MAETPLSNVPIPTQRTKLAPPQVAPRVGEVIGEELRSFSTTLDEQRRARTLDEIRAQQQRIELEASSVQSTAFARAVEANSLLEMLGAYEQGVAPLEALRDGIPEGPARTILEARIENREAAHLAALDRHSFAKRRHSAKLIFAEKVHAAGELAFEVGPEGLEAALDEGSTRTLTGISATSPLSTRSGLRCVTSSRPSMRSPRCGTRAPRRPC